MSDEQRQAVLALKAIGRDVADIARAVGIDRDTVRRVVDPEWAARRNRSNWAARRRRKDYVKDTPFMNIVLPGPSEEEFRRMRKLIPEDTRTLTERLLGGPLPGRSALDMKMRGQA